MEKKSLLTHIREPMRERCNHNWLQKFIVGPQMQMTIQKVVQNCLICAWNNPQTRPPPVIKGVQTKGTEPRDDLLLCWEPWEMINICWVLWTPSQDGSEAFVIDQLFSLPLPEDVPLHTKKGEKTKILLDSIL